MNSMIQEHLCNTEAKSSLTPKNLNKFLASFVCQSNINSLHSSAEFFHPLKTFADQFDTPNEFFEKVDFD